MMGVLSHELVIGLIFFFFFIGEGCLDDFN